MSLNVTPQEVEQEIADLIAEHQEKRKETLDELSARYKADKEETTKVLREDYQKKRKEAVKQLNAPYKRQLAILRKLLAAVKPEGEEVADDDDT